MFSLSDVTRLSIRAKVETCLKENKRKTQTCLKDAGVIFGSEIGFKKIQHPVSLRKYGVFI